ncbi:GTPase [Methanosarcina sp. 1.H.T.1A.1]|jgi:ribosome biogenesis GTPase A|uniref:GTPase n=1 Tax=Methanosarcina sp. 1.H.T.1A.1 TaxID=1483602 RepID=UPI000621868F|nr:GTPase [Methanosarcina sp. 1.H.T.1A.1]KKH96047.1 GTPase [Methanosarcina sp. 1.H.T.1A.1]
MASYKVLVRDVIKKADVLLEVIDARFPEETRNSEVEKDIIRLKKPFIIVINKCDLVSKEKLDKTKSRLSKIAPTVFISSKDRSGTTMLRHQILASACNIKERDILVGTLGYPNVGKSSVINGVTGRHRASTSPISGHTKGVQHVGAGSRIMFIDTPGVIPFDENDEYVQGLLGIKDVTHLRDPLGVALKIIEKMLAENKTALESCYNITIEAQNGSSVLELIGKQCNFLQKKGEVDEMRTAAKIINDWQTGQLLI